MTRFLLLHGNIRPYDLTVCSSLGSDNEGQKQCLTYVCEAFCQTQKIKILGTTFKYIKKK